MNPLLVGAIPGVLVTGGMILNKEGDPSWTN